MLFRSLANKLLMLIRDKGLRNELAHNAREYVEENFSWDVVAVKIGEVYNLIV